VQLSIPELDGQANAQIRYNFTTNSSVVYDGWYVDDIAIDGSGPSCVSIYPPDAEFTSNTPVQLGQAIEFTNMTTGTLPMTYTWDFGDGDGTSTEMDPSYTYGEIGTYSVTLVAENPYGTDTSIHPVTVVPVAINSVDLSQVTMGPIFPGNVVELSADLLPDNAGKPYNYTIDFGDGTVVSDVSNIDPQLFNHIYLNSGIFTVQIWVWNTGMVEPVTDFQDVLVSYKVFLPVIAK
jgi:PKD repeat protein